MQDELEELRDANVALKRENERLRKALPSPSTPSSPPSAAVVAAPPVPSPSLVNDLAKIFEFERPSSSPPCSPSPEASFYQRGELEPREYMLLNFVLQCLDDLPWYVTTASIQEALAMEPVARANVIAEALRRCSGLSLNQVDGAKKMRSCGQGPYGYEHVDHRSLYAKDTTAFGVAGGYNLFGLRIKREILLDIDAQDLFVA